MKQIKRIIIILLAAVVVTGVTFAIAQSSSSTSTESSERPAFSQNGERPTAPFGEGGERRGQGGFNFMEIGKSVIIMTIISAVIIIGDLTISRFRPKRTVQLAE
jgi:hypothetical protein